MKNYSDMGTLEKLLFHAKIFKKEKIFSLLSCKNWLEGHYQSTINEGLVVWSNNVFAKFFGFDGFSDAKKKLFMIERYVHKDRRAELLEILEEKGSIENFDSQYFRNDGSVFWMRVNAFMYKNKGVIEGYAVNVTDIKELQAQFEDIVQNSRDIVCETLLEDGRLCMVSDSVRHVTGSTAEDLLGVSISDLSNSFCRDDLVSLLKERGELRNYRIDWENSFGEPMVLSGNFILLRDEQGRPSKIRSYLRDITKIVRLEEENKILQQKLSYSQKMEALGLLAGGVAHDLNNVLSGIVSMPELILMQMDKDNPFYSQVELIRNTGKRAVDIVNDLLFLARRGIVKLAPLDLNRDVVEGYMNSAEFMNLKHDNPQIKFSTRLEDKISLMNGSNNSLQNVLMNLMNNAVESIEEEGEVSVSTRNQNVENTFGKYYQVEPGEYVVLSVSDSGSGISDDDLPRIFEPFYTKKMLGRSGTGIGMSIVWGILQDHKGFIDIKSGIERGTTFDLFFPVAKGLESRNNLEERLKYGAGERILIVDDVEEQREIGRQVLEQIGYNVDTVSSGERAIKYIRDGRSFDLILLDMIMSPGIDGYETYKEIIKINPSQKVIIVSGYSESAKIRDALELGAKEHIKKPYSVKGISDVVYKSLKG